MYKFFSQYDGVVSEISTKKDGNMKMYGERADDKAWENFHRFCQETRIDHNNLVYADVAHGTHVAVITDAREEVIKRTDALVTKHRDIYLAVTSADCFPVLFYDKKSHVIGIAHAGWRSIVKDIVPHTLNTMKEQGAKVQDTLVMIGPGISKDNFDFRFKDMIREFGIYNQDKYVANGSTINKIKIDLRMIIVDQLEREGIKTEHIHDCGVCTYAHKDFFSARRDGDDFSVMMSIIGMI